MLVCIYVSDVPRRGVYTQMIRGNMFLVFFLLLREALVHSTGVTRAGNFAMVMKRSNKVSCLQGAPQIMHEKEARTVK